MKKMSVLLLSLSTAAAIAAPASAAERAGAFSVSPFVGGYTFDGAQKLDTAPTYGLRLGYDLTKNIGIEALGSYLATDGTRGNPGVNAFSYRLDFLYNFLADGPLVPYLAAGGGGITIGHGSSFDTKTTNYLGYGDGRNTTGTADIGGGVKYYVTDSIALRGDARQIFVFGQKTVYNWEYTAGLTFLFGGKATPAAAPVTPAEPEPAKAVEPAAPPVVAPVPPPPAAPTASLSITPVSITKGESAQLSWTSENTSNCTIQPGIGPVNPSGSMNVTPAADTPYTLTCKGGGGVTTSAANIVVTAPKPAAKLCSPTVLNIKFDTNKSDIKPQYRDELKKVGDFLTEYPKAKGVIEGHTDSAGKKATNMRLSQRRADNIRNYLIKTFNIAPERITAKGYGPTKPITSNKTAAGKQKNRRIEANFSCE